MAAVKGVNFTKSETPTSENIVAPGVLGGRVRVHQDTYEAAALADPSTIQVGKQLQAGAKIIDVQVFFDALGAGTQIDVGDADDSNRYITTTATTSAGSVSLNAITGHLYEIGTNTDDDIIVITSSGGAATGTIQIVITYAED